MIPDSSEEMLAALDSAIGDHVDWATAWFCAALAGGGFSNADLDDDPNSADLFHQWLGRNSGSPLLEQPAFQALRSLHRETRQTGRGLARRIEAGNDVGSYEIEAFADLVKQFHAAARRLEKAFGVAASELDPLTGLHNRFAMRRELLRERERSLRNGKPCTIAIADLDHFKSINDQFGHAAGDKALQAAAEILSRNVRPFDHVFRYGGEEFLICLPDAGPNRSSAILDRIRQVLGATPIEIGLGEPLRITASFGAAMIAELTPLDATIEAADEALYQAKQDGRNRIVIHQPD
ncbi:MAG: diguanylate cyclase [Rhodospirillales bacterium]